MNEKWKIAFAFAALFALVFIVTAQLAGQDSEKRFALIIGNAAYKSSPLANPANDAADMKTALVEL